MLTCLAPVLTPPGWLSRTVTRKFIVRVVVGNDSPKVAVPDKISDNCGKVRAGLGVGANERKIGRLPLSVFGGPGSPKSYSSQQYVRASASGSLAVAVSVNGVPAGIV